MAKSIIEDVRDSMRTADALYRLIYVNIGVYLVLLIANSFTKLFSGNIDDTVLTMADGQKILVKTKPNSIIQKIIEFRKSCALPEVKG